MKPCILYARISSEHAQGDGYSIDAQLENGRAYIKLIGGTIAHEFVEMETAKQAGREKFNQMLELISRSKQPMILVVQETDRLTRNFTDKVAIDHLIETKALEVHLYKEGEILGKASTSHQKLMHGIKVVMSNFYVNNLSEKTRTGMIQKVKEGGWAHRAPYGYRNNREQKTIEIDPETAPFVREAFKLYASGLFSLRRVGELLRQAGFSFRASQPVIGPDHLHRMLQNPIYKGIISYGGETYQGTHEPLVSADVWAAAQAAFKKDSKPERITKRQFVYSGILTCGECGAALSGEYKKGGKYTYYRCSRLKHGCSQGYVAEHVIDAAASALIASLSFPASYESSLLQAIEEMEGLREATEQEELARLNKEIKRNRGALKNLYMDKATGKIDQQFYDELAGELNEQIANIEKRLHHLNEVAVSYYQLALQYFELPKTLRGIWFQLDGLKKGPILKLLTSNFIVEDGEARPELIPMFKPLQNAEACLEWYPKPDKLLTHLAQFRLEIEAMSQRLAA